jgi:signal peptidase I
LNPRTVRVLKEILVYVLIAAVLYVTLQVTMQNYTVVYTSMTPGIQPGDWIRVSKFNYWFGQPERGDVVVFDPPESQDDVPYIKRVIGLPGDSVEVRDQKVWVNGKALDEPYLSRPTLYNMAPTRVPAGQYFVLGDNRNNSIDSHGGWTVPRENIVGRAWFTYWTPSRWGGVNNYPLAAGPPAAAIK